MDQVVVVESYDLVNQVRNDIVPPPDDSIVPGFGEPFDFQRIQFIGEFSSQAYNFLIIGTGFDDNIQFTEDIENFIKKAQGLIDNMGLNINIVALSTNFPVDTNQIGRLVSPDPQALTELNDYLIANGYPIDAISIAYNSTDYFGSGGIASLFPLYNPHALYLLFHERIGHGVGELTDGYKHSALLGNLQASTTFYIYDLPQRNDGFTPRISTLQALNTQIRAGEVSLVVDPEITCKGLRVYRIIDRGDEAIVLNNSSEQYRFPIEVLSGMTRPIEERASCRRHV
ncbi:MAG: hypothetical protein Q9M91_05395 [Candidatus Dojkabacteria bacterium]|nr:hypothetical protein [Candidatus Dojkabacteria bacterium]